MKTENNKIKTWGTKKVKPKRHLSALTFFILIIFLMFVGLCFLVVEMTKWSRDFDKVQAELQLSEYELENLLSLNLEQVERLEGNLEQVEKLKETIKEISLTLNEIESDETIIRGIIGEAIGEPEQGIIAVTWVIRNRMEAGMPLGLSALNRKDLDSFISRQPQWKKDLVEDIWSKVKLGQIVDPTGGAKYFENVNAFGRPPWINQVEFVLEINNHRFYK